MEEKCKSMPKNEALGDKQLNFRYGREMGFPSSSVKKKKKKCSCNTGATGDVGLIPRSGRFPGGRYGNSLQYSCLENSMDRGAWRATVHRVAQSRIQLSTLARMHT